ncbi:MAG: hypothetical protein NC084_04615 [Bacteroides sp.]|nr:hypothetical protein [Eubacterium sp.]MCM1418676.1 hypothetical protein [Roseburia sp.]MCM1461980.1 hypothetical protein [Bacteroides sp.]
MRFKRIVIPFLSACLLCTSLNVKSFAETTKYPFESEISPMYKIASNPSSELEMIGNMAYCTSQVSGTAVSISAEQTLQKYQGLWIWDDVKDVKWTKNVSANSLTMSNSKSGLESGTYRVKTVFTLTDKNGKTETVTVYSDEVSC